MTPTPFCNGDATNAGDQYGLLRWFGADTYLVGLARNARTPNVNIVTAGGEIITGIKAQCDIVAAGGIVIERISTGR